MQLQADVLGVPVVRPVVAETTALGAAYAAGLAVGLLEGSRSTAPELEWPIASGSRDRRSTSDESSYRGWQKAVERTLELG